MANIKSSKKDILRNEGNRQRNVARNSEIKTFAKKCIQAIEANNEEQAVQLYSHVTKLVDKAAHKRVLHRNKAARIKSKLAHQIKAKISSTAS